MHLTFTTTPQLEQLREEVRAWLADELPEEFEGFQWDFEEDPRRWAFYRQFWKRLGSKRWLEPAWPSEYGGAAMSPRQAAIVRDELTRRRVGVMAGIHRAVGPLLLRLGTPEQKATFLPGMAGGQIMWGECYTEPDAGSDLAALRTSAVRDGDDWLITGQKTMSTATHQCNWLIIAARSDSSSTKPHEGISYFLAPRDSAGVDLQPMYNIAGGRQNFVFFDQLRVPGDRVLGEVHKGWQQVWLGGGGNPTPIFEDDDPGPEFEYEPYPRGRAFVFEELLEYARSTRSAGARLCEEPRVRNQLIDLAIGIEIEKVLEYEEACRYGPHLHAAITKEFEPEFGQIGLDIVGPSGLIQEGPWSPLSGEVDRVYRRSFGNHAGGTSQLKRMIIATRILGLPR